MSGPYSKRPEAVHNRGEKKATFLYPSLGDGGKEIINDFAR